MGLGALEVKVGALTPAGRNVPARRPEAAPILQIRGLRASCGGDHIRDGHSSEEFPVSSREKTNQTCLSHSKIKGHAYRFVLEE